MAKSKKIKISWELYRWEIAVAVIAFVLVTFLAAYVIMAHTPARYLIPGYPTESERARIEEDRAHIKSLEQNIFRWELYTSNLRNILEGGTAVSIDSLVRQVRKDFTVEDIGNLAMTDSILRQSITKEENKYKPYNTVKDVHIEGIHFFRPLAGTVTRHYEAAQHPYVDITAPSGSPVLAILDGNVIYCDWSEAFGWTVAVQHQGGIISIYRHNRTLLKKVADQVSAGTAIAFLGDGNRDGMLPHLHFELWQNGIPLDPSEFINF